MTQDKSVILQTAFWTAKRVPSAKRPFTKAITFLNDGKHLNVVGQDGALTWLRFAEYSKEVPCSKIPGTDFGSQDVRLKTFGHTIDGHVIVLLREAGNNWMIVVSVGINRRVEVGDSYRTVMVSYVV